MVWVRKLVNRIHSKYFERHRQNKKTTKKIDNTMTLVGTMGPAFTSLQVFHIFSTKVVSGISPISWFGYMVVSFCWLIYGFFYKDKALVVVNSLSLVMNSFILSGYFIYR